MDIENCFLGRDTEIKEITGVMNSLFENNVGSLVFITGGNGIGKTSLLKELEAIARQKKLLPFYGIQSKGDRLNPLGALEDVVKSMLSGPESARWVHQFFYSRGVPVPGSICSFKELDDLDHLVYSGDDEFACLFAEPQLRQRHLLFDSVFSLMKEQLKSKKFVLLLDDLSGSDLLFWDLLTELTSQLSVFPIVIICASKETDSFWNEKDKLEKVAALSEVITASYSLPLLKNTQLASVINKRYTSHCFTDDFVARLVDEARGLPLMLNELCTTFELIDVIYKRNNEWFNTPVDDSLFDSDIKKVIYRRLQLLSPDDIILLEFVAGLPPCFPMKIFASSKITSYIGLNEREILKTMARFSGKFKLFELNNKKGHLRFPFLREAILSDQSEELVVRDNEIVAEGLDEVAGDCLSPLTGVIAKSLLNGREYQKAAAHLDKAARYLQEFGAVSAVVKVLNERLEAFSQLDSYLDVSKSIYDTHMKLARCHHIGANWHKGMTNSAAAISYASFASNEELVDSKLSIALNCIASSKYDVANTVLVELEEMKSLSEPQGIITAILKAQVFCKTGVPERALALLKELTAATSSSQQVSSSLIGRLLLETGNIWLVKREYDKADTMYEKAVKYASPTSSVYIDLLCYRAEVALAGGQNHIVEDLLAEAMECSDKISYFSGKASIAELYAELVKDKDPEKAIDYLCQAQAFLLTLNKPVEQAKVCSRLGMVYRGQGKDGRALYFLQKAYELLLFADDQSDHYFQTALAYGEMVLSENKLYDGEKIFSKVIVDAKMCKNIKALAFAAFGLGKVFLAQRKKDKARDNFITARDFFKENQMEARLSMVEKELRLLNL